MNAAPSTCAPSFSEAAPSSAPVRGEGDGFLTPPPPLPRFFDLVGVAPLAPSHLRRHRWRLARCGQPADTACLWDGARRLGIAGDSCISPRLEDAWHIGVAPVARVLVAGGPG